MLSIKVYQYLWSKYLVENSRDYEDTKIIKQALSLMKQNKLTMDNLALKTGLSRSYLYRTYGGKKDIIKLVSEQTGNSVSDSIDIKKKILKAARTVFARKGFFRATIEETAKEALVGTATIYRHFETKEKLIQAFKDEYTLGSMMGSIIIEDNTNLEEFVYFVIQKGLEFIGNNRDLFRMSFFEGEEGLEYYRTSLDQTNRSIPVLKGHFEKLIKLGKIKNIDPSLMAYSLLGLIMGHGYIKPAYSGESFDVLDGNAKVIADIFLKGIKI